MRAPVLGLIPLLAIGCASGPKRDFVLGVGLGAGAGAAGGAAFSPNRESRPMNALVFGLVGALAGGTVAYLKNQKATPEETKMTLKDKELQPGASAQQYVIGPDQGLPDFVRRRLQPAVVEEYVEADQVSGDGTLHEPHKVYRIERPAEFFARPVDGSNTREDEKK